MEATRAKEAARRARALYTKVGLIHWNEVKSCVSQGRPLDANELLAGLSDREFLNVREAAEGELGPLSRARYADGDPMRFPDMAQRMIKHHQDSREDEEEMVRLVFEKSGLSERLSGRLHNSVTAILRTQSVSAPPAAAASQPIRSASAATTVAKAAAVPFQMRY
jgi:hypothetical protein